MARTVLPFPALPGKTRDDLLTIAEEFKRRPAVYAESRRQLGVKVERAYLQTTPKGMFVVAYVESTTEPGAEVAAMAQSDLDIDKFFVRNVRELHGIDLTQPPQGPPPETVGEWVDPQVTERRRGMAFCAPLIAGAEDRAGAFIKDAFSRPGMTESRRALGDNVEVVTIIRTPNGPVGAVYLEGNDPWEANRGFAASTSEFDTWFKNEIKSLFPPFIDFGQPVPGVEEIFDSATILRPA
jgi:hypothetical protein